MNTVEKLCEMFVPGEAKEFVVLVVPAVWFRRYSCMDRETLFRALMVFERGLKSAEMSQMAVMTLPMRSREAMSASQSSGLGQVSTCS